MPSPNPKGNANSLPAASQPRPTTPPSAAAESSEPMDRGGLAQWLLEAASRPAEASASVDTETPATPPEPVETAEGTTETTAPETTPDVEPAAGEPPAETETDLSQPDPEAPAAPEPEVETSESEAGTEATPGVAKRIDKLRRKLGDTERELERIKGELAAEREAHETPAKAAQETQARPGSFTPEEASLAEQQEKLQHAIKVCRENPSGLTVGDKTWSAEDIEDALETYRSDLVEVRRELKAKVQARQAETRNLKVQAEKTYPWLLNRDDPRASHVRTVLQRYPQLDEVPGLYGVMAEYVQMKAAQIAAAKAAPKPAPAKAPPPAPAPPAATRKAADPRKATEAEASKRLTETGSRTALADLLRARGV